MTMNSRSEQTEKYSPFEVRRMLERMTVIVDTREQDTPALRKRLKAIDAPYIRSALSYGDYTCQTFDDNNNLVSMVNRVVIERKMSADELCGCLGRGRNRFEREFLRAKADGARVWLLVENTTWEQCYAGKYRSKLNPAALTASLISWAARYNIQIVFCKAESTPRLIKDILHYELREFLEGEKSEQP